MLTLFSVHALIATAFTRATRSCHKTWAVVRLHVAPGVVCGQAWCCNWRDLQVAIEEKKRQLAEKQATLRRTLGRSKGQSLDPLDDSSLPRQAKVRRLIAHLLAFAPRRLLSGVFQSEWDF